MMLQYFVCFTVLRPAQEFFTYRDILQDTCSWSRQSLKMSRYLII
jgi:hypothetical protein